MKCSACGEENVRNARFCAYCGARLPAPASEGEPPRADEAEAPSESHTAQPISENPYQPRRMPTIYADGASHNPAPSVSRESARTASRVPRVFLFDEEKEEEARREREAARRMAQRQAAEDPFFDEEDEEDDDDYEDEEDSGRGRRIFAVVISLVTVLILVIGAFAFLFYTPTGSRMRAYYGLAAGADDYVYLAEWQLKNGNEAEAAVSFYNAFLLNRDDYAFALQIAQSFERCEAYERAEQMYMYLIEQYPLESDPYDYLMALLVREGKTEVYEALIVYRAEHQPGYVMPSAPQPAVAAPSASPAGGSYTGSVHISLAAEEGAAIYFTVDGSEPTEESRLYTGPVILYSGSYTLRAIAVTEDAVSEVFEAAYTVS